MTTEEKILKIIKDSKGKVPLSQIGKELKIGLGYAELVLKALQRKGKVELSGRYASLPRSREDSLWLQGLARPELGRTGEVKKKKILQPAKIDKPKGLKGYKGVRRKKVKEAPESRGEKPKKKTWLMKVLQLLKEI